MKTIPFWRVERGEVFRFVETGDILAKVGRTRVLVCDPCFVNEDERGKIVSLVKKDLEAPCAVLNLRKGFYKPMNGEVSVDEK